MKLSLPQLKQLTKFSKKHLMFLGAAVLLAIIVIGIVITNNRSTSDKSNENNNQVSNDPAPLAVKYTFISSEYSCKQVPPTPTATNTIEYCDGKLTLLNTKDNKNEEFEVTNGTHFYINGAEKPLSDLAKITDKTAEINIRTLQDNPKKLSYVMLRQQ